MLRGDLTVLISCRWLAVPGFTGVRGRRNGSKW